MGVSEGAPKPSYKDRLRMQIAKIQDPDLKSGFYAILYYTDCLDLAQARNVMQALHVIVGAMIPFALSDTTRAALTEIYHITAEPPEEWPCEPGCDFYDV